MTTLRLAWPLILMPALIAPAARSAQPAASMAGTRQAVLQAALRRCVNLNHPNVRSSWCWHAHAAGSSWYPGMQAQPSHAPCWPLAHAAKKPGCLLLCVAGVQDKVMQQPLKKVAVLSHLISMVSTILQCLSLLLLLVMGCWGGIKVIMCRLHANRIRSTAAIGLFLTAAASQFTKAAHQAQNTAASMRSCAFHRAQSRQAVSMVTPVPVCL